MTLYAYDYVHEYNPNTTHASTAHCIAFMIHYNNAGVATKFTLLETHEVNSGFVQDYHVPPLGNQIANHLQLNRIYRIYGGQVRRHHELLF